MEGLDVGIVVGSDSDLPVMEEATRILHDFGVPHELKIASAHRSPDLAVRYAQTAEERGIAVIIAAAGMAAHLPGVLAAYTCLPVIGVPLQGSVLQGMDALFSIVQMPPGVPVASVAVNGARNAALLAVQMLGIKDPDLRKKLRAYKDALAIGVLRKSEKLNSYRG
jgi:5-(carboxyamino)imidazole ribonucleotide mutase